MKKKEKKKSTVINYKVGDSVKFNFNGMEEIHGWIVNMQEDYNIDDQLVIELADDYSHLGWNRGIGRGLDKWKSVGSDCYLYIFRSMIVGLSREQNKTSKKWPNLFPKITSSKS